MNSTKALSQMAHFICTFGLVELQWLLHTHVPKLHETVGYPICHFRFQKDLHKHHPLLQICALEAHFCRACTEANSATDFLPTIKAVLCHESAHS